MQWGRCVSVSTIACVCSGEGVCVCTVPAASPSGPASALKAAALYNLRLRQLQLFLQSLPEEQRPHSIPELKALLQRSGGHLSALVHLLFSRG